MRSKLLENGHSRRLIVDEDPALAVDANLAAED